MTSHAPITGFVSFSFVGPSTRYSGYVQAAASTRRWSVATCSSCYYTFLSDHETTTWQPRLRARLISSFCLVYFYSLQCFVLSKALCPQFPMSVSHKCMLRDGSTRNYPATFLALIMMVAFLVPANEHTSLLFVSHCLLVIRIVDIGMTARSPATAIPEYRAT